jgi:two-component system sensor kinase
LLTLLLTDSGAEVVTATNGLEAVQMLTEQNVPVDVVLLDMQMPVMDGYTAANELRARSFNRPLIAMTANAMVGDDARCRESGCSDYLSKPIDLDLLLEMVRDWAKDSASTCETKEHGSDVTSECSAMKTHSRDDESSSSDACLESVDLAEEPILPGNWLREFACELIDRVSDEIPQMLAAWEKGDLKEVARQAHWIKGSGGTVGLHKLSKLALDCETAIEDEQLERIKGTIEEMNQFLVQANRERNQTR